MNLCLATPLISHGNSTSIKSLLKHRNEYKLFHNSTQATRSRTPTSCQGIYNTNQIGHWMCLPGVAYEETHQLENIQKTAMRILFRGLCYNEAIATAELPMLADRRETLYTTQSNQKLHHLQPHPRKLNYAIRNVRVYLVFHVVGLNVIWTHFYYMACTIGINRSFLITCE